MRSSHSLDRLRHGLRRRSFGGDAGFSAGSLPPPHLKGLSRAISIWPRSRPANVGDKLLSPSCRRSRAATASMTQPRFEPAGRQESSGSPQGSLDSRHVPAQLPLGPCPPARCGSVGNCWLEPGKPGRTGSSHRHDRTRLDDLRTIRLAKGGAAPPRLHRCAGLSPPPRRCRGTGDVLMERSARKAGPIPFGAPPTL